MAALSDSTFFQKFQNELANPVALVMKAKEGVATSVFDSMVSLTGFTKAELASFIDTTPKTIDNYRFKKQKLGRTESEQLLQILHLYKKGIAIFGSSEAFNQWLREPAYGLGNNVPLDFMYTPGGVNLILEELIRIEFGALA